MFTYFFSNVDSQDNYLGVYKILSKKPEDCTDEDFASLLATLTTAVDKPEIALTDALLSILSYCGFGLESYKQSVFEEFFNKCLTPAGYTPKLDDVLALIACLRELSAVGRPSKDEILGFYDRLQTLTAKINDKYLVAGAKRLFLNIAMNIFTLLRETTVIQEVTTALLESDVTLDETAAIASDLHLFEKR